jgi:serine phosphatase RsbU (regulator of sigma subunit)
VAPDFVDRSLLPGQAPDRESFKRSVGEMFGFPRLRTLVGEHDGAGGSLVDRLLRELFGFVGNGREQEDDITLVTLLRTAAT